MHVLTEIINKVKQPPPLCRPIVSVEEAPLDVIQLMKQAWSEEPDKRPTFEEILKLVKTNKLKKQLKHRQHAFTCGSVANWTLLIAPFFT